MEKRNAIMEPLLNEKGLSVGVLWFRARLLWEIMSEKKPGGCQKGSKGHQKGGKVSQGPSKRVPKRNKRAPKGHNIEPKLAKGPPKGPPAEK